MKIKLVLPLFTIILIFCIPISFSQDSLFNQLNKMALDNIENLDESKRDACKLLLHKYNDILMSFLIASEEPYKLEIADLEHIEAHYEHIKKYQWHMYDNNYSAEFFLSYIAKITVTDEKITPYRDEFYKRGINELADNNESLYKRAIALNLWCRGHMTFQPTSGRDMDPISILNKCNRGRCEEMQIFFISAARSIGIPSRPASTPLWAHTDNNHAWVEVFIDGRWHYLGAAEPEYCLNKAWFTSNLDKALIVIARGFLPDITDISLFKAGNIHFINSTANYYTDSKAGIRNIKLKALDKQGNPLFNTSFHINVFNWGMLRPVLKIDSKDSNMISLDLGTGSFIVTACNNSDCCILDIPPGYQDAVFELILPGKIGDRHYELKYPQNRISSDDQPEPENWKSITDSIRSEYDDLVGSYQGSKIDFAEGPAILGVIWAKFRNNKEVFRHFYEQSQPDESYLKYLDLIDEKFLWQCTARQLADHHIFYIESEKAGPGYGEEEMSIILEPGVFFEELPLNRLKPEMLQWRNVDKGQAISMISEYMLNNYDINPDKAIDGLLPPDIIIGKKHITENQFKILLVYLLRQNFIPAVFSRNPGTILVYYNGRWQDFDYSERQFSSETSRRIQKALIKVSFFDEFSQPIILKDSQYTFTVFKNGCFYPIETDSRFSGFDLCAELPQGLYYLHAGYRVSDTETQCFLAELDLKGKYSLHKKLILNNYPLEWAEITPDIVMLKNIALELLSNDKEDHIFLFGDYDREMVQRLSIRIKSSLKKEVFNWIGGTPYPDPPPEYLFSIEYKKLIEKSDILGNLIITLYYSCKDDSWQYYSGIWENLPG